MAAIFRELGSQVTLVELMDGLLPYDDKEMADYLTGVLKRRKVTVKCGVQVSEVQEEQEKFPVRLKDGTELAPDAILLATGRRFNTEGLGLEELGVQLEKGRIVVDEHLMTNIPGFMPRATSSGAGFWRMWPLPKASVPRSTPWVWEAP